MPYIKRTRIIYKSNDHNSPTLKYSPTIQRIVPISCFCKPPPQYIWVAVGRGDGNAGSNTILVSKDGLIWSGISGTKFIEEGYGLATNNNGLWVASGKEGFLTSKDGKNWSANTTGTSSFLAYDIEYSNGVWVAVSAKTGRIINSSDGLNWTLSTGAFFDGSEGYSLFYGNNLWVAVGQGTKTILTSIDGKNWSANTTGTLFDSQGTGVCYGNGLWVAVGQDFGGNPKNTILTSVNGLKWDPIIGTRFTNQGFTVFYGNNLWVAFGQNTLGFGALTSTDGKNWLNNTDIPNTFQAFSVTYANSLWVAVGEDSNTLTNGKTIYTSKNGLSWSLVSGTTFYNYGSSAVYGLSSN